MWPPYGSLLGISEVESFKIAVGSSNRWKQHSVHRIDNGRDFASMQQCWRTYTHTVSVIMCTCLAATELLMRWYVINRCQLPQLPFIVFILPRLICLFGCRRRSATAGVRFSASPDLFPFADCVQTMPGGWGHDRQTHRQDDKQPSRPIVAKLWRQHVPYSSFFVDMS